MTLSPFTEIVVSVKSPDGVSLLAATGKFGADERSLHVMDHDAYPLPDDQLAREAIGVAFEAAYDAFTDYVSGPR